jgi:opacity protein-like surface antigen
VRSAAASVVAGIAALFMAAPASANSLLTSPVPVYNWYFGAGIMAVHHTGFVPNTDNQYNVEKYEPGGKAYIGYRINNTFSAELGFDYFGSTSFNEGFPTMSTERSFAVTGTVLVFSPPMSEWMPGADRMWTSVPVRLFARGGFAYKNIHQDAFDGTFEEGILSFVIGGGAQIEIDPRWFMRVEYEFVSSAVGGPSQPFTALNGLFTADFGGTNRVVNAMHTEVAVSGGFRF